MEYEVSDGGIVIPRSVEPAPTTPEPEPENPVVAGWNYSRCDERYSLRFDDAFRRYTIESLYIINHSCQIPAFSGEARDRINRLIDALSVELVGGVPESYEEFT